MGQALHAVALHDVGVGQALQDLHFVGQGPEPALGEAAALGRQQHLFDGQQLPRALVQAHVDGAEGPGAQHPP